MVDEKYRWSKDDTLKLIKLYKSFPYLWNSSMPDHRDKDKRSKAIIKIAKEFKTTVPEIQRKLHNLRCSFNQEIRRLKDKNSASTWEFFESMYFVAGQHKRRSVAPPPSELELRSVKNEEANMTDDDRKPTNEEIVTTEEQNRGIKRSFNCMTNDDKCPVKNICHLVKHYDEYQTFGNFVGSELRGISCPYKREDLKRMILQNILTVTDSSYVSPSTLNSNHEDTTMQNGEIISVATVLDNHSFDPANEHVNNVKIEIT